MEPTRRDFLRALAGGAAAGAAGAPEGARIRAAADMPRRTLGRTKASVTILGLGCAYAGAGASEERTRATIEAAIEGGVRYFDAAPEYDRAEIRLGPVVRPIRDRVFLVTKTYAFDAETAEKDLVQALKQLGTDRVDLFLQHGVGLKPPEETRRLLAKGGSLEFLRRAKEKGLARAIGMSVHGPHETALEILEGSDAWDVIMPFINYVTLAQERAAAKAAGKPPEENAYERLLARARARGLGIVAMKVLGGAPGKLAGDFERAFRYALSVPGVACALIGVSNPEQVSRAVRAAKAFRPLSDFEMDDAIYTGEELVRTGSVKVSILDRHRRGDVWSGARV
ncbi:MAG: aldo/keto reductase [Planctomycetes bacterium]|nr:aldo/keto reductase [Planctomycetota bacterium]